MVPIMKRVFLIFSLALLIYMVWPGPNKISDFEGLPNSSKSTLEGDTIQIPNVSAYFSDNFREFIVPFYKENFQKLNNFPFPPIQINRPPEHSWIAIKKHTDTTYIEEFVYPLRGSLYVNGFEPFYSDGSPKFWGSTVFTIGEVSYLTKTTLRYYPSNLLARIIVWVGIVSSVYLLYKVGRKILT